MFGGLSPPPKLKVVAPSVHVIVFLSKGPAKWTPTYPSPYSGNLQKSTPNSPHVSSCQLHPTLEKDGQGTSDECSEFSISLC